MGGPPEQPSQIKDDVTQTSRPRLRECCSAMDGKRPYRDGLDGKTALCNSSNTPGGVVPTPSKGSRKALQSTASARPQGFEAPVYGLSTGGPQTVCHNRSRFF